MEQSQEYIFFKNKDQIGNDLFLIQEKDGKFSLSNFQKIANNTSECVGFNTLGFLKNNITALTPSEYYNENNGIYVKKNII